MKAFFVPTTKSGTLNDSSSLGSPGAIGDFSARVRGGVSSIGGLAVGGERVVARGLPGRPWGNLNEHVAVQGHVEVLGKGTEQCVSSAV